MAHPAQMNYVKSVKQRHGKYFNESRVLEIGSLNVNGSFRELFNNSDYTGVDIVQGRDVDVVTKGHLFFNDEMYDVVCSGECFEHDEYWNLTIQNMYNLLKEDGLLFFTCASTGRAEHGTTRSGQNAIWGTSPDYYQNLTEEDIRSVWNVEKLFKDFEFIYQPESKDLYFKGVKK